MKWKGIIIMLWQWIFSLGITTVIVVESSSRQERVGSILVRGGGGGGRTSKSSNYSKKPLENDELDAYVERLLNENNPNSNSEPDEEEKEKEEADEAEKTTEEEEKEESRSNPIISSTTTTLTNNNKSSTPTKKKKRKKKSKSKTKSKQTLVATPSQKTVVEMDTEKNETLMAVETIAVAKGESDMDSNDTSRPSDNPSNDKEEEDSTVGDISPSKHPSSSSSQTTEIIKPPPPFYRFLLTKGYIGHVILMNCVIVGEWLERYIPELYSLMVWFLRKWQRRPQQEEQKFRQHATTTDDGQSIINEQYSAFVDSMTGTAGGKKVNSKRRRAADIAATKKLKSLSSNSNTIKYQHLSPSFMKRHNLGKYAEEKKIYENVIGKSLLELEQAVDGVENDLSEDDIIEKEEEEEDWVVQALTDTTNYHYDFEDENQREQTQMAILEAAVASRRYPDGSRSRRQNRPKAVVRRRQPLETDSVLGRIRSVGASTIMTSRILGAYPGDALSIQDAANSKGLVDYATQKYGYGDWSDDENNDEHDEYNNPSHYPKKRRKRKRRRRTITTTKKDITKPKNTIAFQFGTNDEDNEDDATFSISLGIHSSSSSKHKIRKRKRRRSISSTRNPRNKQSFSTIGQSSSSSSSLRNDPLFSKNTIRTSSSSSRSRRGNRSSSIRRSSSSRNILGNNDINPLQQTSSSTPRLPMRRTQEFQQQMKRRDLNKDNNKEEEE